jgi:L-amino acid N-acyltransferase YncA
VAAGSIAAEFRNRCTREARSSGYGERAEDRRGNAGSIGGRRKLGFAHAGTLRSVGCKLGGWVDTVLMQRALGPGDATLPDANGLGGTPR